ncbi:YfiR family protein [Pelotalea chapellei]|uniref:DUF4154 domain-containing protein n=1 Tax=Pelotalea chapellei TaxID=44671 RepID=A0ABS5UCY4_9BACT|nr:YfiR family protein [Pelotalea chapellei]MBT1073579.1 DUF4154 domain-containing protein [Pelotalea chapellei]
MSRPSFSSRLLILPLLTSIVFFLPETSVAEQTELSITSAFLTNVLDYIEWNDKKPEPSTICVAGDMSVITALRERIEEQKLTRTLSVKAIETSRTTLGCTALFVDNTTYQRGTALLLNDARSRQVLTIGNGADFLTKGGIIQLQFNNRKLSFSINTKSASRSRIRIKARLLELAKQVF